MGIIANFNTPPDLNTPTPLQEEATQVQRDFEAQLPAIRANTTLSVEGKMIAIAQLFVPAYTKVATIQRDENDRYQAALDRTEQRLFGDVDGTDSTAVISTRDAFDRVEQIAAQSPGHVGTTGAATVPVETQILRLLERAKRTNDAPLVQAIVATAVGRGWHQVLDAFVGRNTDLASAIENYYELRKYDPAVSMMAFYTYKISVPWEITNIPINRLEEIAANGFNSDSLSQYGQSLRPQSVSDATRAEYARMQSNGRSHDTRF